VSQRARKNQPLDYGMRICIVTVAMQQSEPVRARALVECNLKGLGEKKLAALDLSLLRELVRIATPNSEANDKDSMIRALLKHKKCVKRINASLRREPSCEINVTPSTRVDVPERNDSRHEVPDHPGIEPVSTRTRKSIFKPFNALKIIAFNALKLRLNKEELYDDWLQVVDTFVGVDAVVLSEVCAGNKLISSRLLVLANMLKSVGRCAWNMTISEPSDGPGPPEVHALLCRERLKVLRTQTLHSIGAVQMHHAPLMVLLEDTLTSKRVVITSVHMPPEGRRVERDAQVRNLLRYYAESSLTRMDLPFTEKGAKDTRCAPVAHVLLGDWNCYPGDPSYGADKLGYDVLFGKNTATTSGMRAFDNILISKDTRHMFTSVYARVLELARPQNSARGVIGISDHNLICLEFQL
jgi:endonuclease/exonuclease/phosphatase family metal-dependent hydrolase